MLVYLPRLPGNLFIKISKTGKLFTAWGEDYFITNSNYPWKDCPEVVVNISEFILSVCKERSIIEFTDAHPNNRI
jgi:hypothetical protein